MMIPLSKGQIAVIDDEDWPLVADYKWHAHPHGYTWYALAHPRDDKGRRSWKKVAMHQLILGEKGVDHKDGDGLNNQRNNLRIATKDQNNQNLTRMNRRNTSGFRGVRFHKHHGRWTAAIGINGKKIHLGYFDTPEIAAEAYTEAAKRYHGEFANPNPAKAAPKTLNRSV